jgi:hypothetical protein
MKKILPLSIVVVGIALLSLVWMKKKHEQVVAQKAPESAAPAPVGHEARSADRATGVATTPSAPVVISGASSNSTAPTAGSAPSSDAKSAAPSSAAPKVDAALAPVAKLEAPRCYRANYKHKLIESHTDGEVCGHHKNLIRLSTEHGAMTTACVRVDRTPVKFEAKAEGLVLEPVAGPDSEISVTYCVGEACKALKDKCVPVAKANVKKKDEFMEAIGGDADGKELGNWEDKKDSDESEKKLNAALDPAIRREIAHLDDPKPKAGQAAGIFADWIKEDEEELKKCL